MKAAKVREEKELDKQLVMIALKKEKEEGLAEEAAKHQAKQEALDYMRDQNLEKQNDKLFDQM